MAPPISAEESSSSEIPSRSNGRKSKMTKDRRNSSKHERTAKRSSSRYLSFATSTPTTSKAPAPSNEIQYLQLSGLSSDFKAMLIRIHRELREEQTENEETNEPDVPTPAPEPETENPENVEEQNTITDSQILNESNQNSNVYCIIFRIILLLLITAAFVLPFYSGIFEENFANMKADFQSQFGITAVKSEPRLESEPEAEPDDAPNNSEESDLYKNIDGYIDKYLMMYDADKTSKSDFALESTGGKILNIGKTKPFKEKPFGSGGVTDWFLSKFSSSYCDPVESARALIQASMIPGQCWAFRGHKGEVTIRLLGLIFITEVSLEHIPISISPTGDILSAPRKFHILGLESEKDSRGYLLGTFEYDKNGKPLQVFKVNDFYSNIPFNIIKMVIQSNWGNAAYTCVYRLRVHGVLAAGTFPI